MLCPCTGENEIRKRTMVLFDLLKEYRWDAKAVLVLGVLAATYGGLLLPVHLAICDPVAASIAKLNQLHACSRSLISSKRSRCKFSPFLYLLCKMKNQTHRNCFQHISSQH